MRRLLYALAGGLAIVFGPGQAWADPLADANSTRAYFIGPEAGPWVISAAAYTGSSAPEIARQVVNCLRQRDRLPAYIFDRSEGQRQEQRDYVKQMHERYGPDIRVPVVRIEEQCVVLIGGYRDMDSARHDLDRIKKLKPPDVNLGPNQTDSDILMQYDPERKGYQLYKVSPFINSFVTRNPTTPHEAAPQSKVDPFLKKLNAKEEYSLLECKAPWTLVVKDYPGAYCVQSHTGSTSFLDNLFGGDNIGKQLNASARQANETARVLRALRYEAYALHTRQGSCVTIGGFTGPEDARIKQLYDRLVADQARLATMQLNAQPLAMEIPRP